MATNLEYTLQGDINTKLQEIKRRASLKGVTFKGNTERGIFYMYLLGLKVLDGNYEVFGSTIRVTVTVMPPGYTVDRVDAELRGFIEG